MNSFQSSFQFIQAFIFLFVLTLQFRKDGGIFEFDTEHDLTLLENFKANKTNIFLGIIGNPCSECEILLNSMQMAEIYLGNDLDNPIVFIKINSTKYPYFLKFLKFNLNSFPEFIELFSEYNYTPKVYKDSILHFDLIYHIKDYFFSLNNKLIYLLNYESYKIRSVKLYETVILGILTNGSNKWETELIKNTKIFKSIKFYYTYNSDDFSRNIGGNYSDTILIMKNPYLFDQDIERVEINQHETIKGFILSHYTNPVDLCTQSLFNVYEEGNMTFAIFFSSPRNSKEEVLNMTEDLAEIARSYPQIHFCISLNGFDTPSVKQYDVKKSGEIVIVDSNGKIFKDENMMANFKIIRPKVKAFLKQYLAGSLIEFSSEKEITEFSVERSVIIVDNPKEFKKFTKMNQFFFIIILYNKSIKPSLVNEINKLSKIFINKTENKGLAIIDTSMFKVSENYLKYGDHNTILFQTPQDHQEITTYRGPRIHSIILDTFEKFKEEYEIHKKKKAEEPPIEQNEL